LATDILKWPPNIDRLIQLLFHFFVFLQDMVVQLS